MAIGTGAALLGSAVLGIGGSVIGANSNKKAAKQGAGAAQQVANTNNALAREIYNQNRGVLDPYVQRGNAAGGVLNALLGLSANNNGAPAPAGVLAGYGQPNWGGGSSAPSRAYKPSYSQENVALLSHGPLTYDEGNPPGTYGPPAAGYVASQSPGLAAPQGALANPADPFRQYLQNSDYAFQFGEGANALNHGYAAQGLLQSGAAMKALEKYRQNLQQGYRGEYMNLLGQQQAVGLSGASALSGVGQNFAGLVTSNNNSAGSAAANAALMKGAANSSMWNGIGGALGGALGAGYGSGWWSGGGAGGVPPGFGSWGR